MKNKVVYIITIIILSASALNAQKPTFTIIPAGKFQKIPEAVIDLKYYNDNVSDDNFSEDSLNVQNESDPGIKNTEKDVRRDFSKYSETEGPLRNYFKWIISYRYFTLIRLIPFNYIIS